MSKKLAYYFIRNAQYDVCTFINDDTDGNGPRLMLVNDTRHEAKAEIEVTDIATGKNIYKETASVSANAKTLVSNLPQPEGKGIWLISYKTDGKTFTNHYLYGQPPFQLDNYRELLKKTHQFPANL